MEATTTLPSVASRILDVVTLLICLMLGKVLAFVNWPSSFTAHLCKYVGGVRCVSSICEFYSCTYHGITSQWCLLFDCVVDNPPSFFSCVLLHTNSLAHGLVSQPKELYSYWAWFFKLSFPFFEDVVLSQCKEACGVWWLSLSRDRHTTLPFLMCKNIDTGSTSISG